MNTKKERGFHKKNRFKIGKKGEESEDVLWFFPLPLKGVFDVMKKTLRKINTGKGENTVKASGEKREDIGLEEG